MGDEGLGRVKTGDDGKEGYKKLVVWKNAKELRALVHRLTGEFPKLEVRRISQMRDAARSVKQNIQEGYQRRTRGEYLRGLEIAKGSLAELQGDVEDCLEDGVGDRTQLLTAFDLCKKTDYLFMRLLDALRQRQLVDSGKVR